MPSDSPIIITDGSTSVATVGDDFTETTPCIVYTVTKKSPPQAIKIFLLPEIKLPANTPWTVNILDPNLARFVTLSGSSASPTVTITAVAGLFSVNTGELTHASAPTQIQITVGGALQLQSAGCCKIRFR